MNTPDEVRLDPRTDGVDIPDGWAKIDGEWVRIEECWIDHGLSVERLYRVIQ